jgi:hypothetical protein
MTRLVEIRIEDAVENIGRIEGTLSQAIGRKSATEGLYKDLCLAIQSSGWIEQIQGLIAHCKRALDRNTPLDAEIVRSAGIALAALDAELGNIARRASQSENNRSAGRNYTKSHQLTTKDFLDKKMGSFTHIMNSVATWTSDEVLHEIDEKKPYWSEHIETVAGIVLRDEEFDSGLAIFADEIIRICRTNAMIRVPETLNILGRDKTEILQDLKHAVYLRFPTWSIWGLSLAAHDAWHASDKGDVQFAERLKREVPVASRKEIWANPLLQECLADAYATYVIGPAYAFTRILLSLNVHSRKDQIRAETIFAALDHLARLDGDISAVAEELRTVWREAGGAGSPSQVQNHHCLLERECQVADALWSQYWDSVDRAGQAAGTVASDLASLRCPLAAGAAACPLKDGSLIASVRDSLLRFLPLALRYPEDEWLCVGPGLLNYFRDDTKLPYDQNLDIRHILRAAWMVRFKSKTNIDVSGIQQLAERARELCRDAVRSPRNWTIGSDVNGSNY